MRALLDACVLYPTVLRGLLSGCAMRGLITPLWSARILEEWRRAVLRTHPEQAERAGGEIALLRARFPDAGIAPTPDIEPRLSLPDLNDIHVLATAIAGKAEIIVTFNLRDFPARALGRHTISPRHPDALLCDLWRASPKDVGAILDETLAPLLAQKEFASHRDVLKKANLPRLAKLSD